MTDFKMGDKVRLIVETWHLRTLRDDEEVRDGDLLVWPPGGAATVQAYDVGHPACVVALLGGRVLRRCGPLGEDL